MDRKAWVFPSMRILLIALAGVIVIYAIGRWDGRISQREREHEIQYRAAMGTAHAFHRMLDSVAGFTDSLRKADEALALQERRTSELLRELDAIAQAEVDSLASTAVADLLPSLRMRPIQRANGDTVYAADEDGVRFLSGRLLRLAQVQRQLDAQRDLADTRATRIANLLVQTATLATALDTAQARINILEPLLEESNRLRKQKGKWFGLIPKPPPEIALLVGVVTGIVITR
ncbi:MAG: hypothetical protein GY906_26485 [bacterium]|nr:hypothetical protein [bacterium]